MDRLLLNEFRYLTGQLSRDQLSTAEDVRVLKEDPNSFFAPTRPYTGRKQAVTSKLMGAEQPEEDDGFDDDDDGPDEDVTVAMSPVPPEQKGDAPEDIEDFEQTLRDPRLRRQKEIDAGQTRPRLVGPADVSR